MTEICKAVVSGARCAVSSHADEVAEIVRAESEARWLRDALQAGEHYMRTGQPLPRKTSPNEALLNAIFGEKK